MNQNIFYSYFLVLLGLCILGSPAHAEEPTTIRMKTEISTHLLVRGEQATLEYILPDGVSPNSSLSAPTVPNLDIRPVGSGVQRRRGFGHRQEFVFGYRISGYQTGTYTIPSRTVKAGDLSIITDPVTLSIVNETDLNFKTIELGGRQVRYVASFYVPHDKPYVNEVMPAEIKVYFPANQRIEDWGIPEFERDGLATWRFEPRPYLSRAQLPGGEYYSVSYPSTTKPTRSGEVTLGPAKLRLITIQTRLGNFGPRASYTPVNLEIDSLKLEARELPPNPPKGFSQAVGEFAFKTSTDETQVREGDPVSVDLTITGVGNLDSLSAPEPLDSEGWKLYPPSSEKEAERRSLSGTKVFRQFLRPLAAQSKIPSYKFVYFNPEKEKYETIISDPIPLSIIPAPNTVQPGGAGNGGVAAAPPPALAMPIEEMTDILGTISHPAGSKKRGLGAFWNVWQVIPALLAVLLCVKIFSLHLAPRLRRDPILSERNRELRQLAAANADDCSFYRAAGSFIEKWLGTSEEESIKEILKKRDEKCFRTDIEPSPISSSERNKIVRLLRQFLPLILLACFSLLSLPKISAAEDALPKVEDAQVNEEVEKSAVKNDPNAFYESGNYRRAAELWLESGPWQQLSADTLYNIGNAAYRLGSPGEAALYWRRALVRQPTHAESLQNLRFLERKIGSLTIKRPDYQYTLASLPLSAWKQIVWLGVWLGALGLLAFPASRHGAVIRISATAALVLAPLLIAFGMIAWHHYPDDARFAPISEQGVIVAQQARVRTDAARNSPLVIQVPAGSLCHILAESGDWTYVAFASATRGWVRTKELAPLLVRDTPEPPQVPPINTKAEKSA